MTKDHYWSNTQIAASPLCIFKPQSAASLSAFVLLARLTKCHFAVKAGGHAAFANASSSDGITVSLEHLNAVTVSSDRTTASIGSGAIWNDVYTTMDPQNLTVIGGRASDVGVGGLTLGGGISFFSSLYGWACDNVASYEVVTASGLVLTASATQNTDLFWALRGGGPNFGIVTKFTMPTYPLPGGMLWGGNRIYPDTDFPVLTNAFTQLANNVEQDPKAGSWLTFVNLNGFKVASVELWYANPYGGNASIFSNFSTVSSISDSTGPKNQSYFSSQVEAPAVYGFREYFYTMTVKNDFDLNSLGRDIFYNETADLSDVPGNLIVMTYQSITVPQLQQMSKNGGNPLGLSPSDGPLTLILLSCRWSDAADDDKVYTAGSNTLQKIKEAAIAADLHIPYVYMNYASQYQDPIASYGAENQARLEQIASLYDPTGVWQTLTPGFFKLNRAPINGTGYFSY